MLRVICFRSTGYVIGCSLSIQGPVRHHFDVVFREHVRPSMPRMFGM
jgi:hypothetical protein